MIIDRSHRRTATGFCVLMLAGLLPGPVLADVQQVTAPPVEAQTPPPLVQDVPAVVPPVMEPAPVEVAEPATVIGEGVASYYGYELAGNRTANGERFDPKGLTAAHRTLPMGTKIKVVNIANGKSVVVRINDRGPFVKKRIIDVSHAAAQKISMIRSGTARVRLERLS